MQLEFAWILWSVVLQPLHMQQGCLHLSWDLIRMSRVFRSNQKKTDPKEHKEQGMMDQALESKNLLNSTKKQQDATWHILSLQNTQHHDTALKTEFEELTFTLATKC